MAIVDKDFKVKNGLVVTNGGTFGGTVTIAPPTENTHATTKLYVDTALSSAASVVFSATAPENPTNGKFWFDTVLSRLSVYSDLGWVTLATLADAQYLQDHIHDTSIDGSGLIVSVFQDAGYYNQAGAIVDGGNYNTAVWTETWDGGIATDNFN